MNCMWFSRQLHQISIAQLVIRKKRKAGLLKHPHYDNGLRIIPVAKLMFYKRDSLNVLKKLCERLLDVCRRKDRDSNKPGTGVIGARYFAHCLEEQFGVEYGIGRSIGGYTPSAVSPTVVATTTVSEDDLAVPQTE